MRPWILILMHKLRRQGAGVVLISVFLLQRVPGRGGGVGYYMVSVLRVLYATPFFLPCSWGAARYWCRDVSTKIKTWEQPAAWGYTYGKGHVFFHYRPNMSERVSECCVSRSKNMDRTLVPYRVAKLTVDIFTSK